MLFALPYIFIVVLFGFLAFLYQNMKEETTKKYIIYGAVSVFLIFFGLRGFILTDWINYYNYYNNLEWYKVLYFFNEKEYGYEPGFAILVMICKMIYPNYFFLQFIASLILTLSLFSFFKRYSKNFLLSLMLYIVFEGIYISTNLVRNSIAISIFLLALPYLEQRKPLVYFPLCLLATSFHLSALIYFPLYFFFHIRLNKWIYLSIFMIANMAFISHFSFILSLINLLGIDEAMEEKVRIYTEIYTSSKKIFSIGYLERFMTGILVFLYYDKLKALHPDSGIFINAILAFLCIFFFFAEFEVIAQRLYILFAFGYWIVWGYLIECFYYHNNKRLFSCFIMLYCILKMNGNCSNPAFDYENLLTGHQSYSERLFFTNKYYKSK